MAQPVQLGALSLTPPQPITRPRVKNDKPAYAVIEGGFYDDKDTLWKVGQALYYNGTPNLGLMPLNKLAYDKMQAFLDSLDALGAKKAKKEGKEYVSPYAAMRAPWSEDGEEIEIPSPDSVLGMKKEGNNEAIR